MKIIRCKNNAMVSYKEIKDTEFIRFEIWLNFGSKHDIQGQDGIGHLIEHLLSPLSLASIDLYSFYHSYAYTNKERIRIYIDAHYSNSVNVLKAMMRHIVDFAVDGSIFNYQQRKVSAEIKYTRFGPVTGGLQELESTFLTNSGYGRLPVGNINDINSMTYSQVKSHLVNCLEQFGMQISITGACSNIKDLVNVIEQTVYPLGIIPPIKRLDTQLFQKTNFTGTILPQEGHMLVLNKFDDKLDPITNLAFAELMEAYLRPNLMRYPIDIEDFNYRPYQVIVFYNGNNDNSAASMVDAIQNLCSGKQLEKNYNLFKSHVYYEQLHKSQNYVECCLFEAEQLFWGTQVDIYDLINHISLIREADFIKYVEELFDIGKYIHVVY